MCVHSFAISWQTALAVALREETRLLPGATGRFLIPELMQPPAVRAPGHSSSYNVCVSSDLPTTTWFSHYSERRRLTISLTNERAGCVRGQAHSPFALSSSSRPWAQFSLTLLENISPFPPIFSPSMLKGWNPPFQTLHLAAVSPPVSSPLGCDWQATIT